MKQNPQTVKQIEELLRCASPKDFAALKRSLAADTRKGVIRALDVAERRIKAQEAEAKRLKSLYDFDGAFSASCVIGLDEVGRGPLVGPLAVGGVVLDPQVFIEGLNDSKQIPETKRDSLTQQIKDCSLAWTVRFVEPSEIDAQGMTFCLRKAFSQAIQDIESNGFQVDLILLDGNPLHLDKREHNVIKGDAKSASIAAASLIAKVERDALMRDYARSFPVYDFEHNKGYASETHIAAIREHGLSKIHRKSFCTAFLQETLF